MSDKFFKFLESNKSFKSLSVICLNGELPDKSFFAQLSSLPLIAIDGAANNLVNQGLIPNLTLGDLDSIDNYHLDKLNIIKLPNQDQTDFQKSLIYLNEKNLLPAIITGINGGYLDHILCNIGIFSATNCIFYSESQIGFTLAQDEILNLPINTKISLLGIPSAKVKTYGLKWELDNAEINFLENHSCFNRCAEAEIKINIINGKILVIIYLEEVIDAGL